MPGAFHKTLAMAALLFVVVFVYGHKLDNGFVFDDHAFIEDAPEQSDLRNIPGFFATDQHRLYRPLRSSVYTLVRHFWGLDPVAHNAAGIGFHGLVVLLFFQIVFSLSQNLRASFFAALIAAVHPMATSHVAFMTSSFDLPGLIFAYASLALFLSWMQKGARWRLLCTLALLLVGLLGSEEAATVPFFMALFYLAMPRAQNNARRFVAALAGSLVILIAYLALRAVIVPGFSRIDQHVAGGLYETVLTMAVVFWRYVRFCFFPVGMAAEHAVPIHTALSPAPVAALIGILALVGIAIVSRKKNPLIFVFIGWFFVGLIPFSNLIPLQSLFAERYLYCSLMGFSLGAGLLFDLLLSKAESHRTRRAALIGIAAVVGIFTVMTLARIDVWHDDKTLWADALKKQPMTYAANVNYGSELYNAGAKDEAMVYWQKAARIDPTAAQAFVCMSNLLQEQGQYEKAIATYKLALENNPDDVPTLEGLVQSEMAAKQFDRAFARAIRLLKRHPTNSICLNAVSYVLIGRNQCEQAIPFLKVLVRAGSTEVFHEIAKTNLKSCLEIVRRKSAPPEVQP